MFEKGILKENRELKPPVRNSATFLSANLAKIFVIAKFQGFCNSQSIEEKKPEEIPQAF